MSDSTIRVNVQGRTHEYPQMIAAFGDYLATGGAVGGLTEFLAGTARVIASADWVEAVTGWVELDDSGLAYLIEATSRRRYRILGASPWSVRELRQVYTT